MADLNESIRALEALEAKLAGETIFTRETFEAHVEAEITKAAGEEPEPAKKRLDALRAQIAEARKAFAESDTFRVKITETIVDTPPRVPMASGVAFDPNVDVAKSEKVRAELAKAAESDPAKAKELVGRTARAIAKALEKDEALRAEVAKAALPESSPEALRVGVSKGMAGAMLSQVASMFGFNPNDEDEMCGIGWKVGDVVRELERAAKLEETMSRMASVLGTCTYKGDAGATPAATPTAKAGGEEDWPLDMNAAEFDSGAGAFKDPISKWAAVEGEEG